MDSTSFPPVAEQFRLSELETVIERGQQTFVEVGLALLEIRDSRLYRQQFSTFEDYCRERWGWSRRHVNRHIEAAEVSNVLGPIGPIPTNEAQARELVPLMRHEPSVVADVWQELREEHGERLTASVIREAVQSVIAPQPAPQPDPVPHKMAVHFTSDSPEWYTPSHIVARVVQTFGAIDLDPCSNSHDDPSIPAGQHYTVEDDGLALPWRGRVYMNPPYGRVIDEWIEKLASEWQNGNVSEAIALLPARTDTGWFRRLPAEHFCFVSGRLTFSEYESAAPFPSVAAYLGEHPQQFIAAFRDVGHIYRRLADGLEAA